jgi:cytoskeletal protein RodZ
MFKNYRDKIAFSGITVLMIGIILLIFTFVSAYGFLAAGLSIIATQDLVRTFGEALAPLIAACIHVMYLGVMGWIGSLITVRGVTIIAHAPQTPTTVQAPPQPTPEPKPQPQPQAQPQKPKTEKPKPEKPKEEKPKEEFKPPPEPQFVVIPPEQVAPTTPASPSAEQKPQQNNNTPPSQ